MILIRKSGYFFRNYEVHTHECPFFRLINPTTSSSTYFYDLEVERIEVEEAEPSRFGNQNRNRGPKPLSIVRTKAVSYLEQNRLKLQPCRHRTPLLVVLLLLDER